MDDQPPTVRWAPGSTVIRRETLGLQPDDVATPPPVEGVWLEVPVEVIEDGPDGLITHLATGAPFHFPDGDWPTPDGHHPWHERASWTGHGCLMIHPPDEHVAIWHFWRGPEREFAHWYLNLQTAFVRSATGFATQDLELDLIVHPDGRTEVKDAEVLDDRVAEGRFTPELVTWVRRYGDRLLQRLDREGIWWDRRWADWSPDGGRARP